MSNGGSYDPHAVEAEIYAFWERGGYFHATPNPQRRPFVIDIPLPNVTGALHLGHAINNTLQDIYIRHKRMCGYETLWMPGTDHAGIATQAVVERRLKEEQNLTRHELGREGLVKKIWEWKEEYGGRILSQLRKIGCSADWPRTRFTLDDVCARAVYEVFFRWFKDGLIYRGLRLVNWDAHLQTAVADDEVIYENVKSHFWQYRYPVLEGAEGPGGQGAKGGNVAGGAGVAADPRVGRLSDDVVQAAVANATRPDAKPGVDYLSIATTRPETMLGDTAVAVHPADERYKHLIGKHVLLPLQNRAIPVIGDALLAKPELGTGCVKVTPGHDPNDYACGQRNGLQMINILTPDGKINDNGGAYKGLTIEAARKEVVAALEALGLMEKIEDYEHAVGHSDRSKTPIEPMLSEQWFVKMSALAEGAMDAVRDGRVQFFPARYAKTMLDWLGEKRDWCISRQLWWGHRIPVWSKRMRLSELFADTGDFRALVEVSQVDDSTVISITDAENGSRWHDVNGRLHSVSGLPDDSAWQSISKELARGDRDVVVEVCICDYPGRQGTEGHVGEFEENASLSDRAHADRCVRFAEDAGFVQDPDVLDTWFSSAIWPFSTLGWPDNYGQGSRDQGAKDAAASPVPTSPPPHVPTPLTDLSYFYPTSVLITARDIITLWVARMVITGLYFQQRVPFQHVYIHPNIQDGEGRRMSKSIGNGVDPLDIIDIYGTDALRFTMAQIATETQDARLPVAYLCPHCGHLTPQGSVVPKGRVPAEVKKAKCKGCQKEFATVWADAATKQKLGVARDTSERFEPARNLCNKLWQAATGFVLPNLDDAASEPEAQAREQGAEGPRGQGAEGSRGPGAKGAALTPLPPGEGLGGGSGLANAAGQNPPEVPPGRGDRRSGPAAGAVPTFPPSHVPTLLAVEDRWILSRLAATITELDQRFARYQTSDIASTLYTFFWSDFCDWYVELVKPRLFGRDAAGQVVPRTDASAAVARQVLAFTLDQTLRLLHPLMPFITEALWRKLAEKAPRRGIIELRDAEPALIAAAWPTIAPGQRDVQVEREMDALQNIIRALRDALARINTARAASKTPAIGKLPHAVIRADATLAAGLQAQLAVLERLGRCERVAVGAELAKPPEAATHVLPGVEVYVPLAGLMDLDAERQRLTKERDNLRGHIERLAGKLANEGFVAKAPVAVVEQERARLAEMKDRLTLLERNLADLAA